MITHTFHRIQLGKVGMNKDMSLPSMDASFSSIVVPNVITAQLGVLLDFINHTQLYATCVWPTGTGKSVFINTVLNSHLDQKYTNQFKLLSQQKQAQTKHRIK